MRWRVCLLESKHHRQLLAIVRHLRTIVRMLPGHFFTPSASPAPTATPAPSLSVGGKVGVAIAAIVVALAAIAAYVGGYILCRRRRRSKEAQARGTELREKAAM